MSTSVQSLVSQPYKYGFTTDIEADVIPRGLSEDVVRLISAKKNEPEFMLEFRLKAYRKWLTMEEPVWPNVNIPPSTTRTSSTTRLPRPRLEEAG
jgi:Fe-S cluster assembly protein SufB